MFTQCLICSLVVDYLIKSHKQLHLKELLYSGLPVSNNYSEIQCEYFSSCYKKAKI